MLLREITRHDYPICIAAYSCFLRVLGKVAYPLEIDSSLFRYKVLSISNQRRKSVKRCPSYASSTARSRRISLLNRSIEPVYLALTPSTLARLRMVLTAASAVSVQLVDFPVDEPVAFAAASSIHQINVCQTHIAAIDMHLRTPSPAIIPFIGCHRNKLAKQESGTASELVVTGVSACVEGCNG